MLRYVYQPNNNNEREGVTRQMTSTSLNYTKAFRAATTKHGAVVGCLVFILSLIRVHG